MFERFWQRLRGQTDEGYDGNDERRSHPRHPANLETTCRLVNGPAETLVVKVRNVSRGGINFLVEEQLAAGTLLRIDLPQIGDGEAAVLACVMHCTFQTDGSYSIGCAFSDELGEADLSEFGGRKEPARNNDKRAWERFPAQGFAEYQMLPPTGRAAKKAEIANISPTGIGLLLDEKIEPGTILDMLLKTKNGEHSFDILACVVFLGAREEGGWVAGCHFIRELENRDLKGLM